MTEIRQRGPWDLDPAPATPTDAAPPVEREAPRQSLVMAVLSTAALAGLIWFLTGEWLFAVAAVVGVIVHEYGHVLAMNRFGMGPARIHIVPFLGGLAWPARAEKSEWDGVRVSLAGPAFGLLACIPFVAGFYVTGDQTCALAAALIALINLVNLAPAPPLDGSKALGPILARIHPMLEKAGLVLIGALVVWWGLTTGRLILVVFLTLSLIGYLRQRGWRPPARKLTGRESLMSLGLFLATAALCGAMVIGVMLPIAGSIEGAYDVGARFLGVG